MTENKYLPAGSIISDKYEVIETLGEDDFEILYLVRDIHRKGSFFVLKELFLETFSSRRDTSVYTFPEAEGVFNKRKKQIIEEIGSTKLNLKLDEIRIYGYEEDNETIYTIMEFSSNVSLEKYLQFVPKDAEYLPTLTELLNEEKKSSIIYFFLKILLLIGFLLAIAFYAYKFFQKSDIEKELEKSVTMEYPILKDRTEAPSMNVFQKKIELNEPIVTESKPLEEVVVEKDEVIEEVKKEEDKNESNLLEEIAIVEKVEENTTLISEVITEVEKEENLTKIVKSQVDINVSVDDINTKIKSFLDVYIEASATSVDASLEFYAKRVKRYFKFRNSSHKTIESSQKRYNKKWVKREFEISDFEIIKSYKKDDVNYYNVKTTTAWNVSNKRGKKLTGKSRGFMILKEVENSFKIISIYTLK